MTRREFVNAETEVHIEFETGPVEADYGYGMHHTDAARYGSSVIASAREYICETCGFRTGSPAAMWDHLPHKKTQPALLEVPA